MTFGQAIELVNKGSMIQRAGWNGNNLFVFKQIPAEIPMRVVPGMQSLPDSVKTQFIERLTNDGLEHITYDNQLALVYPDNRIQGWSPSTSDALATDWLEYK